MPPLQFTLHLPLLGGASFGQIFCFQNRNKNQTNEILVQNYSSCLIPISLLYKGWPGAEAAGPLATVPAPAKDALKRRRRSLTELKLAEKDKDAVNR